MDIAYQARPGDGHGSLAVEDFRSGAADVSSGLMVVSLK